GGVVLAAGDFTASKALKAEFISDDAAEVEAVNASATGDGQTMARRLGARILNGDLALGPEIRFVPPARDSLARRLPPWTWLATLMAWSLEHVPSRLLRPFVMSFVTTALAPSPELFAAGALLVNKRGERFADERRTPAVAIARQPDKTAYIVLDDGLAKKFGAWPHFISTAPGIAYAYLADYRRSRRDIFHRAEDLHGLADALGMPGHALVGAVAARNAEIESLRSAQEDGPPPSKLERGPYVALGPVRSVFVHNEGGLAVDGDLRVLGARDEPIEGLYAAGSTGQGGLLLKGHGHHLAWAFTSGRIAGRNAAYRAVSEDLSA
ncbi:MAG TPA: FAD-binding protein, partial [Kiloniellales bacterium]|nr:FAD-binding protein [Kiloniellales bacterium]